MLNISAEITEIAMTYSTVCDRDCDDMISMMLAGDDTTAASTTDSDARRFAPSGSANDISVPLS